MMRRTLAALLFSVLLICGFASRANASVNRPCIYVWYVLSSTPMKLCLPFESD